MSDYFKLIVFRHGTTVMRGTGIDSEALEIGIPTVREARQWLRENTDCADPDHVDVDIVQPTRGERQPPANAYRTVPNYRQNPRNVNMPQRDPHAYLDDL